MDKCYHITNQVLIYQEEREKPDGTPFVLETYECGECGEEYTEIKLIQEQKKGQAQAQLPFKNVCTLIITYWEE